MSLKALRGVCVGVNRHLNAGDPVNDLDAATVTFLIGIKAVEVCTEPVTHVEPGPSQTEPSQTDDHKSSAKIKKEK